ncbi:MAG: glycosyltransferase 87 family protein [Bacteroidota bacterium]|nr:glycosyltransferase 87 family protein [Bacteroidota bacterium]
MFGFTLGKNKYFLPTIILVLIVILPRIYSLFLGYGSDGDSWRVAHTASLLWNDGSYEPSRPPGFPVFEFLISPFVGSGGSVYSNTFTLIIFFISVFLFGKILAISKTPSRNIILWTYALFPILWENSTVTMDYVLGLTFILMSFLFILNNNFVLSAIFLGLAVGTRLTHLLFLFPLFLLVEDSNKLKKILILTVTTLIVSAICYLPVISQSEQWQGTIRHFTEAIRYPFFHQVAAFSYRSVYTFGLLGSLVVILFFILSHRRITELIKGNQKILKSSILAILLMLGSFFLMPDEREYLIPMIPFLLIIIGITYRKIFVTITCCCLLSYAVLNIDIIEHETGARNISPNTPTVW